MTTFQVQEYCLPSWSGDSYLNLPENIKFLGITGGPNGARMGYLHPIEATPPIQFIIRAVASYADLRLEPNQVFQYIGSASVNEGLSTYHYFAVRSI